MFVIGRGLHKFVWDNVEFSLILRTVGEVVGTSRGPAQKEEMLITVQEKDQLSLHEWVEYIYEVSRKRNLENLQIYVWNVRSQFWELIATRAKRPVIFLVCFFWFLFLSSFCFPQDGIRHSS